MPGLNTRLPSPHEKRPEEVIMSSAAFHRERVIIGDAEYHITTKVGAP